jgi:hypothetical protein
MLLSLSASALDTDVFEDFPSDEEEDECEPDQSDGESESSSDAEDEGEEEEADTEIGGAAEKKPSGKDEKIEKTKMKKRKNPKKVKIEASDGNEWSTEPKALTGALPRFHQHGRTLSFTDSSPIQVLQLIITPTLINQWVSFTNAHAAKMKKTALHVTAEEMLAFLSLHIHMGMCRRPRLTDYWADDCGDNFPRSTMVRDRFQALLSCFCVTAPDSDGKINDPAQHSAALIAHLNSIFPTLHPAPQNLAYDEGMAAYTGEAAIKQYIPSKPHPYGYKLLVLADNDIVRKLSLYEGAAVDKTEKGATYDTVMEFMQGYENKSHVLYCDSYFTSTVLVRDLLKRGIYVCGSVSPNRVEVNQLKPVLKKQEKTLKRGESLHFQKPDVALAVWKDKRVMHVLYNHIHPTAPATSLKRYVGGAERGALPCPQAIHDYFFNARSVDVVGQLRYSYPMGRKAKRAWPRLIWWLIDIAIVNAYSLYRLDHPAETQLNFCKTLMRELAAPLRKATAAAAESTAAARGVPLAKDHYPQPTAVRRVCACDSAHSGEKPRPLIVCAACGVNLCIHPCFGLYHKQLHTQATQ